MENIKLTPGIYIRIIKGKMDRILGNLGSFRALDVRELDSNTAEIAKQINILSDVIKFQ